MELLLLFCLAAAPCPSPSTAPSPARAGQAATQDEEVLEFDEGRDAMKKGDFKKAVQLFRTVVEKHADHHRAWFLLGYSLQMIGKLEDALAADLEATKGTQTRASAFYNAACACAQLGRKDDAFGYLQQAADAGFYNPQVLRTDPDLDPIRSDPRFDSFLAPVSPDRFFGDDVEVLYSFEGESANDQFGWEGRNAGDIDADGVPDMVISAPYKRAGSEDGANAGKIYVYSGATGRLVWTRAGEPRDYLGTSIDTAGDQNQDGFSDVLVGATTWGHGVGKVYVLSGKDGSILLELRSGEPGGSPEPRDSFGWRVSSAGDWNRDGVPELLVGAPSSDHSANDAGRVYLFSGKEGKLLWTASGENENDGFGSCVGASRDCDEQVMIIGSGNAGKKDQGRAFVYEYAGGQARKKYEFDADETGVSLGFFVSIPGDIDGDGRLDYYASDWENCARGRCTGRAYVFSGSTGKRILTLTGESAGDGFGGSGPAIAGDVDGDDCADLIIGAWKSEQGGATAGKAYLYSGRTGELVRSYECIVPRTTFGFDAVGLGDLDGDGGIDFLITAAWCRGVGEKTGRAFVIAGPVPTPPPEPKAVEAANSR